MTWRWKKLPQAGACHERSSHSVTVIGDKVYLFGGEHDPRVPVGSEVHEYSMADGTWSVLDAKGDVPSPRVAHSAAAVGDTIYIYGGRSGKAMGDGALDDLYSFHVPTATWTRLQPQGTPPPSRSYHAMAALGPKLYIFGGCGTEGRLNDLHEYDTVTNTWQPLPAPPADVVPPRGGSCLVAAPHGLGLGCSDKRACGCEGELYVVAGFSGRELDDMHVFRLTDRSWCGASCPTCSGLVAQGAPNALPARSVFGTVLHAGCGSGGCDLRAGGLLVFGGEVDPSNKGHDGAGDFCSSLLSFRAGSGWTQLQAGGEQPGPRGWFACDGAPGSRLVVHGGLDANNQRLGDMFVLEHGDA